MDSYGPLFEAIFEHVLDLPAGDAREAYVGEISAGDADLRAQLDAFLEAEEGSRWDFAPTLRVTPETWPQPESGAGIRSPQPVEAHRTLAAQDVAIPPGRLLSA